MTSLGSALVFVGAMACGSLGGAPDSGQGDGVLERWVDRALASHPSAQAAAYAVEGARAAEQGAGAWMPPSTQLAVLSDGRVDLSVSQMVPGWGKNASEAAVRAERTRMKRLDSAERARGIVLSVREAAWMEWMAWQKVAVLAEQDSAWRKLSQAQLRTQAQAMGGAWESWILRAKESQGRTDLAMAKAQAQAATAMRESWTGTDSQAWHPRDPVAPDWDTAKLAREISTRPDISSMEAEASMMQAMSHAMRTSLRPDFMVGAMAMRMTDGMPGWGVMAGMTLPFAPWSRSMAQGDARGAQAASREAQAKAQEMRRMALSDLQGHARKAQAAWEAFRETDSLVIPGLERAVADVRSRYAQGREMLPMLLSMEDMVRMARMQRIMSRGEYELERVRLQAAAWTDAQPNRGAK
ncbi:MAG: TolC family protein [Fibrobacteres bacterium]|nr:TolC family protein [Fibrobacterota bacterium]